MLKTFQTKGNKTNSRIIITIFPLVSFYYRNIRRTERFFVQRNNKKKIKQRITTRRPHRTGKHQTKTFVSHQTSNNTLAGVFLKCYQQGHFSFFFFQEEKSNLCFLFFLFHILFITLFCVSFRKRSQNEKTLKQASLPCTIGVIPVNGINVFKTFLTSFFIVQFKF